MYRVIQNKFKKTYDYFSNTKGNIGINQVTEIVLHSRITQHCCWFYDYVQNNKGYQLYY